MFDKTVLLLAELKSLSIKEDKDFKTLTKFREGMFSSCKRVQAVEQSKAKKLPVDKAFNYIQKVQQKHPKWKNTFFGFVWCFPGLS
eukprot:UN34533